MSVQFGLMVIQTYTCDFKVMFEMVGYRVEIF